MRTYIMENFSNVGDLTIETIILHIVMGIIMGGFIYLSYAISHMGTIYSKKFNISLLMLTVLTTTVMTVIGNNLALSLGMVGALSIVRFRTAVKDTRDTLYIFWTIIVGICCGVGDYVVAGIGSAATFILLLLFGRIKNDNRMLLIIRSSRINEEEIQALVFQYYNYKATLRTKNTTNSTVEFIYELPSSAVNSSEYPDTSITDEIYKLENVDYVNLVMQNDEVSS